MIWVIMKLCIIMLMPFIMEKYYKKAIEQNNTDSMLNYGKFLLKFDQKIKNFFKKHAQSTYRTALMYEEGFDEVETNYYKVLFLSTRK